MKLIIPTQITLVTDTSAVIFSHSGAGIYFSKPYFESNSEIKREKERDSITLFYNEKDLLNQLYDNTENSFFTKKNDQFISSYVKECMDLSPTANIYTWCDFMTPLLKSRKKKKK